MPKNSVVQPGSEVVQYIFDRMPVMFQQAVPKQVLQELEDQHRDFALREAELRVHDFVVHDVLPHMIFELRSWLLKSQHTETVTLNVSVPATWWDHLKADLLELGYGPITKDCGTARLERGRDETIIDFHDDPPLIRYGALTRRLLGWAASKFSPPRYRTETRTVDTVIRVCPHNNTYFPDPKHIEYLFWKE